MASAHNNPEYNLDSVQWGINDGLSSISLSREGQRIRVAFLFWFATLRV